MRSLLFVVLALFSSSGFAQATSWIPFENANGHVLIKVEVAGIESYAMIDSGSQVNALNLSFAEHHELEFDSNKRIKIQGAHDVQDRRI